MDVQPPKYDSRELEPRCLLTIAIDWLNARIRTLVPGPDDGSTVHETGKAD
jgi:hypothetical protein